MYSRRQFLSMMAAMGAVASAPKFFPTPVFAQDLPGRLIDRYVAAMERPYLAPLNDRFIEMIGDDTVAPLLYNLTTNQLITSLDAEAGLPVASAFKGPVLMYFIHQVDRAVWNSVPVEYWSVVTNSDVPEEYRAAWEQHRSILFELHQMLVFSDNPAVGRVLGYVAAQQNRTDPIAAFNDWSQAVVGVSQLSGMSDWNFGIPAGMEPVDPRFTGRKINLNFRLLNYSNIFTPRDLGLYYIWYRSEMDEEQQRACNALLRVVHNDRGANVERLAFGNDGTPYSKNGTLPASESAGGIVITDAGLVELPDGTEYLVVILSAGAETKIPPVFEVFDGVLKGDYDDEIENFIEFLANQADPATHYLDHLITAYPEGVRYQDAGYNYAFVRNQGVQVYRSMSDDDPVRNPIITNTRFGVNLLMQGALARFVQVNSQWAELLPDNPQDNVRFRLAERAFVKMSDLWPISDEHVQPIGHLGENPDIQQADKFIVIDIQTRELMLLEADQVILKTPIVLNKFATPRGSYVVTTKWFARSMQAWAPGVPFTVFFHNEGYAIHGAPWQYWGSTVTRDNIFDRTSAGCVNVPNWIMTLGNYTRPVDELIFRWVGGLRRPADDVFEYPNNDYPATRIFAVDYLDDLRPHYRPQGMLNHNVTWDTVIENINRAELTAPDSFFRSR